MAQENLLTCWLSSSASFILCGEIYWYATINILRNGNNPFLDGWAGRLVSLQSSFEKLALLGVGQAGDNPSLAKIKELGLAHL